MLLFGKECLEFVFIGIVVVWDGFDFLVVY